MNLKIGTRGSPLALAQSRWVKAKIESRHPGTQVELVRIRTTGDRILDSPLSKIGGKGLFVKEIEAALLKREVHLAVHSMKDVPALLPDGLVLCAFPEREDPLDALISRENYSLEDLPRKARVGTGSLRRAAQLRHLRPDLEVVPLRGNVDTRLRKLDNGEMDAVVLAAAGLRRLGLSKRIGHPISPEHVLPAIGQGALGLEVRQDDSRTRDLLEFLNHDPTEVCVRAERAFLKKLEGGCQVPIAAYARAEGREVRLQGMVAELDGSRLLREEMTGDRDRAEEMGTAMAVKLLAMGAGEILARIYSHTEPGR
ncbi:MAG: hydroxymethylbilane synthase [Deltaproteobacteria bacterium]|nr:MAG: hydroxymethylbilane synthase [Deltaproteobacteria bacterium]